MPLQTGNPSFFQDDQGDQESRGREKPEEGSGIGADMLRDDPGRHEGAAPEERRQEELDIDDHESVRKRNPRGLPRGYFFCTFS